MKKFYNYILPLIFLAISSLVSLFLFTSSYHFVDWALRIDFIWDSQWLSILLHLARIAVLILAVIIPATIVAVSFYRVIKDRTILSSVGIFILEMILFSLTLFLATFPAEILSGCEEMNCMSILVIPFVGVPVTFVVLLLTFFYKLYQDFKRPI